MNEDDRNAFIIELYRQTMEEIRERRRIEWQTFAVVSVIYAAGLKLLLYDYKEVKLTIFEAVIVTIAVLLFTSIWFIRIYGNARRYDFSSNMRNRIQDALRHDPDPVVHDLMPPSSVDIYGGWRCWINSWPLWSGHVCIAVWLYCIAFLSVLWGYRTKYIQQLIGSTIATIAKLSGGRWGYEPKRWQWLVIIGAVLLPMIALFLFDRKLAIHRTCFLFRTKLKFKDDLDKFKIPSGLQEEFEKNKLKLSKEASIEKVGRNWLITDKANEHKYFVKKKKSKVVLGPAFLKIYDYNKTFAASRKYRRSLYSVDEQGHNSERI